LEGKWFTGEVNQITMEGNKQLYKISSEVNFDIDTIMNLWDYLTINYPSNVVKPSWRIPVPR
jgi:hypothetical protein